MRNIPGKNFRDNQDTFCVNFLHENRIVYVIMWKSTEQPCRPQMTMMCMRNACWIPKATNTRSEYVIPIAFPRQQRLHEHTSMWPYPCIAWLVYVTVLLMFRTNKQWLTYQQWYAYYNFQDQGLMYQNLHYTTVRFGGQFSYLTPQDGGRPCPRNALFYQLFLTYHNTEEFHTISKFRYNSGQFST
jgi:hypothetical protein